MTISAKIIRDSITKAGVRVTTFQLRYPRMIHSELMTHRVFSRNASSSRAIPVERLIQDVIDDTAMPVKWGRNQRGMQAGEDWNAGIDIDIIDEVWKESEFWGTYQDYDLTTVTMSPEDAWLHARDNAIKVARAYAKSEYHKQVVNRLLEPFAHINVIVTSTDYENFFALRYHPDADPTIEALAHAMYDAREASTPFLLTDYNWHLPYIRKADWDRGAALIDEKVVDVTTFNEYYPHVPNALTELMIRVSVARCARVSYLTHDGKETTVDADLKLYDQLLADMPLHASPAEHQATPDNRIYTKINVDEWQYPEYHGNLYGVIQYRKLLKGENQKRFILNQ